MYSLALGSGQLMRERLRSLHLHHGIALSATGTACLMTAMRYVLGVLPRYLLYFSLPSIVLDTVLSISHVTSKTPHADAAASANGESR